MNSSVPLSSGISSMSCDFDPCLTSYSSNTWPPPASLPCHVCSQAVANYMNLGWRVSILLLRKHQLEIIPYYFHFLSTTGKSKEGLKASS